MQSGNITQTYDKILKVSLNGIWILKMFALLYDNYYN